MTARLLRYVLVSILLIVPVATHGEKAGTVYVVIAVDTEPFDEIAADRYPELDLTNYDTIGSQPFIHQVMNSDFRSQYLDSYDRSIKFTFFIETSEAICNSTLSDCAIILAAMEKFREPMLAFGDELAWHYHHVEWRQADWDTSLYFWSQDTTFDSSDVVVAEKTLNHLLIDYDFFPTLFRSGWTWENTDISNWLDEIVPFDFSNLSPLGGNEPPCSTVFWDCFDWSRAPTGWTNYHPSRHDYQVPGDCKRAIFRCNCSGMFSSHLAEAFEQAATGSNIYVCAYSHSSGSLNDFLKRQCIGLLQIYSEKYNVPYVYATANEAARAVLGFHNDTIPPVLSIKRSEDKLLINSEEDIFQSNPYCALRVSNRLKRIIPIRIGDKAWVIDIPADSEFTIAIGVCDLAGNASTAKYEINHE